MVSELGETSIVLLVFEVGTIAKTPSVKMYLTILSYNVVNDQYLLTMFLYIKAEM